MAKLTTAQVTILRTLREAGGAAIPFPGPTRSIGPLQRMFAIKSAKGGWVITPTGRTYLDEYERAAEYKRAGLERASRPVPASAFVEPSAKNAPVLDHEYEDEPEDEVPAGRCPAQFVKPDRAPHSCDLPAGHEGSHRGTNGTAVAAWDERSPYAESSVPQAWIDQLAIFLQHGAKIRKVESGWYAEPGYSGFSLNHTPGRLDATVREAIRRGIVRELPPTATGIVRLALVE